MADGKAYDDGSSMVTLARERPITSPLKKKLKKFRDARHWSDHFAPLGGHLVFGFWCMWYKTTMCLSFLIFDFFLEISDFKNPKITAQTRLTF